VIWHAWSRLLSSSNGARFVSYHNDIIMHRVPGLVPSACMVAARQTRLSAGLLCAHQFVSVSHVLHSYSYVRSCERSRLADVVHGHSQPISIGLSRLKFQMHASRVCKCTELATVTNTGLHVRSYNSDHTDRVA
jgi:hypothetical protein